MQTVVLDRGTLLTGKALRVCGFGSSAVLWDRETDLGCALGQYLLAEGVPKKAMLDKGDIKNLHCALPEWMLTGSGDASSLARRIVNVNDGFRNQRLRERSLKLLFTQVGVQIKFVGRSSDAVRRAKKASKMS